MIVDCDGCAVRGPACPDCVVSVLLGVPGEGEERAAPRRVPAATGFREEGPALLEVPAGGLDDAERAAVGVLAAAGLVPPLRLVPVPVRVASPEERGAPGARDRGRPGGRPEGRPEGRAGGRAGGRAEVPAYDARRGATRAG